MKELDRVYCSTHEKWGYHSRKDAKRAAKQKHPGEHLDAYPCSRGTGLWHIGHLPEATIRRGVISRHAILGSSYRDNER